MERHTQMDGQIALVVGAGSGIGLATAEALALKGATVICADLDLGTASRTSEEITQIGGKSIFLQVDVTQQNSVEELVDTVILKFGHIDAMANTVGVTGPTGKPSHELDVSEFMSTFEINFYSAIRLQNAIIPHMLKQGYGRIMHVASIAGKEGNPNMAPYSASKAALIGFVKSTAKEVVTKGITINSIAPAVIRTPMNAATAPSALEHIISKIPMSRLGEPWEVAEVIAFALSPAAGFISGFVFDASGGRATY